MADGLVGTKCHRKNSYRRPDPNQLKLSFVQHHAPPPYRPAQNAEGPPIASQSAPFSENEPDGNHGSAQMSAGAPGSDRKRKHQDRWLKIWPWLFLKRVEYFVKSV